MFTKKLRLIDIARQIDRDKSTIIRWEEMGLIPMAPRDSRGWRYYSEEEVQKILELVKSTNYFKDTLGTDANGNGVKPRAHRMVYIGVLLALLVVASQLFKITLP